VLEIDSEKVESFRNKSIFDYRSTVPTLWFRLPLSFFREANINI